MAALEKFQTNRMLDSPPDESDSAHRKVGQSNQRTALPAVLIVCTFFDGGVGLYDIQRKEWMFYRDKV